MSTGGADSGFSGEDSQQSANEAETNTSNASNTEDVDDDDEDNASVVSGLSDLSGSDWKPMAGPFSWARKHMMRGTDPKTILRLLLDNDEAANSIPDDLDQLTIWKIILNLLSEPPRRTKLPEVDTLEDVVGLIRRSRRIIVLTGAGVSVSCGIPDFRSRDGVYARLAVDFPDLPDPESMFDIHYFRKDPRPFFKFAKEIYPGQFRPSPCHRFIRALERKSKLLRNYTQNIDTLEQVAGIERVVQCHGSFATATCTKCKRKVTADEIRDSIFAQSIPFCTGCEPDEPTEENPNPPRGIMKPDIVFFGEGLGDEFHNSIAQDKDDADLLIMIGSSLKVRPVALIPSSVPSHVPQVLINRERLSHLTPDVELLGDCDGIVNQLCHLLKDDVEEDAEHSMWSEPIHGDALQQTETLPPVEEEEEAPAETEEDEERRRQRMLAALWRPRPRTSRAKRLPSGKFLFEAPNRYVFPGAEIFSDNEEDEDDDDGASSSSSSSSNASESNIVNNVNPGEEEPKDSNSITIQTEEKESSSK